MYVCVAETAPCLPKKQPSNNLRMPAKSKRKRGVPPSAATTPPSAAAAPPSDFAWVMHAAAGREDRYKRQREWVKGNRDITKRMKAWIGRYASLKRLFQFACSVAGDNRALATTDSGKIQLFNPGHNSDTDLFIGSSKFLFESPKGTSINTEFRNGLRLPQLTTEFMDKYLPHLFAPRLLTAIQAAQANLTDRRQGDDGDEDLEPTLSELMTDSVLSVPFAAVVAHLMHMKILLETPKRWQGQNSIMLVVGERARVDGMNRILRARLVDAGDFIDLRRVWTIPRAEDVDSDSE